MKRQNHYYYKETKVQNKDIMVQGIDLLVGKINLTLGIIHLMNITSRSRFLNIKGDPLEFNFPIECYCMVPQN